MHLPRFLKSQLLLIFLLISCLGVVAQPDYTLPLAKPEKYRNKELGAEKTDQKKFTLPRRLFQGMITHYNYYYNANVKLNAIIEKAKLAHRDDYTELLPFYNYSTKSTAGDSVELDSILYKATAGIVLHDLRNSYIDNLYLLIGQAYFLWGKYDSAYRMFQFINYNFYPKAKDEYFIVVGSNAEAQGGQLRFATKEKKGIIQKAFSQPPSRNEALLWLARTYAEDSLFAEASSLVQLLRKDPVFPKRLHTRLDEVQAFVHYQQELWDSTAFYLEKALPNAANKAELARWEYLLAQLYSRLKKTQQASSWFNKAKNHTPDPVLYIHARIYEAQLVNGQTKDALRQTLDDLVKMSKRERFDGFEDVLYYAAAGMALDLPDTAYASGLLQKSVQYNTEHPPLQNRAFLKLASLAYHQKNYPFALACYDSLDFQDETLAQQRPELEQRKEVLGELVKQINEVKRQDSLQTVAKMPQKEMDAYLKTLLRRLRKAQGLKEEEEPNFGSTAVVSGNQPAPALVFANATGNNWYFNNAAQKSRGFNEFRARWGKRPNLDNWRRQAAVESALIQNNMPGGDPSGGDVDKPVSAKTTLSGEPEEPELSIESLKEKLPLTDEKLKQSNQNILSALITQGQIYKNKLEDYPEAIRVYEEIMQRFSKFPEEEEVLLDLYYCYNKTDQKQKAYQMQQLLKEKFAEGKALEKIELAGKPKAAPLPDAKTRDYEEIYNLFIEGRFQEALSRKQIADSVHGTSYWTPQLLYIESLYHIKQRNDSVAIEALGQIEARFPNTAMAEKAAVLKDVVSRRAEIEDYLANADIVRVPEDSVVMPFDDGPKVNKVVQTVKDTVNQIKLGNQPGQQMTLEKPNPIITKAGVDKLQKPAAGNINLPQNLPNQQTKVQRPQGTVAKVGLDKQATDAKGKISVGSNLPKMDSSRLKPVKDVKIETAYLYNANEPYVVLMYFDKVDPIYISESKIAFQRYNNSSHSGEQIPIQIYETNEELNWLELGNYPDVSSVLSYMEELRNNARQIVPWLPANKYGFLVISERNLEVLKTRKSLEEYRLFIRLHIKDKF